MKTNLLLAASLLHCACQANSPGPAPPVPPSVTYSGGDGLSFETAVLIEGATRATGIQAEYAWLAQQYPGYRRGIQALTKFNGRMYDIIEIRTADGASKRIHFDITGFWKSL